MLVTGATGFVGSALCELLRESGYQVRAALRSSRVCPPDVEPVVVGDIGSSTDWSAALAGIEYVVHSAARVHIANDSAANASLYSETNTQGTRRLAEAAVRAGVRRLVFVSTIKVNGEERAVSYRDTDPPAPQDAYGVSKLHAEVALHEVAAGSGMQFAIARPPLVYGPGVRANFLRLMRWIDRGVPLPLGAVHNKRSLVSVWNLCDLLMRLLVNPAAANRVWMVSDGQDLSTPELIRQIASTMGRKPRLLAIPPAFLAVVGTLLGRRGEVSRLCESLTVDISETRRVLDWSPPLSVEEGIRRTVQWYRGNAG